jgi:hypothetical protein
MSWALVAACLLLASMSAGEAGCPLSRGAQRKLAQTLQVGVSLNVSASVGTPTPPPPPPPQNYTYATDPLRKDWASVVSACKVEWGGGGAEGAGRGASRTVLHANGWLALLRRVNPTAPGAAVHL